MTSDFQHPLISACQRQGGPRWSHDRLVVSESGGDYVEQGVIKDMPWLDEAGQLAHRLVSGLCTAQPDRMFRVCVDIVKLPRQKPELQWHVASQKLDTLAMHWRTGAPRSSASFLYFLLFAPPPDRVQRSTFVSFKHLGFWLFLCLVRPELESKANDAKSGKGAKRREHIPVRMRVQREFV